MIEWIVCFLILFGGGFCIIAAIGVLRFPDLFCRMHAATKAGAFGVASLLLAAVLAAPSIRIVLEALLIVLFFYLTAPLAAHMIGRVAWKRGEGGMPRPRKLNLDTDSSDGQ